MHYSLTELDRIYADAIASAQSTTAVPGNESFDEPFPYAFFDQAQGRRYPAAAVYFKSDTMDGRETRHHSVLLAAIKLPTEVRYAFWCGDAALNGRFDDTQIEEAINLLDGATDKFKSAVTSLYRMAPLSTREDAVCNFYRVRTKSQTGCKHSKAMFASIRDMGGLDKLTNKLESRLNELLSTSSVGGGAFARVTERAFQGVNFLLKAERGVGKTRFAQTLAKTTNAKLVEGPCFDGIESRDFLGGYFPDGTGSFVWLDGPVAEAFREAQSGKTVLLLDELLRSKQLSVLLSALSPTAEGTYRLRTERILSSNAGLGQRETIECPQENLIVIGTTNVGDEYDVESMDPAVEERFIPLTVEMSADELAVVLRDNLAATGLDTSMVAGLLAFHQTMKLLKRQGQLREATSTRSLSRAIDVAGQQKQSSKAPISDVELVKTELRLQQELWVEFDSDGKPIEDQVDLVEKALKKVV